MSNHSTNDGVLRSGFNVEFNYTRTYGPTLSKFFTALKNKQLLGIKAKDGRVLCPPQEYDPVTSETLDEWVELGQEGLLQTWCWVEQPLDKHPCDEPFAWALIQIDGADSLMTHALMVDNKSDLKQGLRVRPVWAQETKGWINDIAYFEQVK